jgi:hypothetical protein
VSGAVTVTLAPGTPAPVGSVTIPDRLPVACANTSRPSPAKSRPKKALDKILWMRISYLLKIKQQGSGFEPGQRLGKRIRSSLAVCQLFVKV